MRVDEFQRTSVAGVFCAGEPTGIGGVELALVEGQIAGLAAGGRTTEARELFARTAQAARNLPAALEKHSTCVRIARLCRPPKRWFAAAKMSSFPPSSNHDSWRAAKLQTRCGMGPCQGRVCGPATQFLFKWNPDSVRPPIFPARVEEPGDGSERARNSEHQEITGGSQ